MVGSGDSSVVTEPDRLGRAAPVAVADVRSCAPAGPAGLQPGGSRADRPFMRKPLTRGFTLIEVMVTVAVVGILASIALPSYSAYVQRSRVPAALDGLQSYFARMEQRYQDTGNYANNSACGVAVPTVANFTVSCTLQSSGQAYTATATGTGSMAGYTYTINHQGVRSTTAHPRGVPSTSCWSTRGATCDT